MAIESSGQYQALARKYRPQSFDDVVGQEHVVNALKNSIDSQRIHHAYLLTGTRGIGKTTIARIIAKCLECEEGICSNPHEHSESCSICSAISEGNFPDVIEIDAASQTKVDDTRALLENTQYPPLQGRFKVYIIDEVHMLSTSSFNALLKTLEEPPSYVKFILATTDPQKIPTTVLSRCLQFQLKSLTIDQIASRIEYIASKENIPCQNEAAVIIARAAKGSMRDALSLCDQAVALGNGEIKRDTVLSMLGTAGDGFISQVLELLKVNSQVKLGEVLSSVRAICPNYKSLLDELVQTFHDLALYQMIGGKDALNVFTTPLSILENYSKDLSAQGIQLYYQICLQGLEEYKVAADGASAFEMTVLRMLAFTPEKKKDWLGEDCPELLEYLNNELQGLTPEQLLSSDFLSLSLPDNLAGGLTDILSAKSALDSQQLSDTADSSDKTAGVIIPEAVPVDSPSKDDISGKSGDTSAKSDSVSNLDSVSVSNQGSNSSESSASSATASDEPTKVDTNNTETDTKQIGTESNGTEAFVLPKNNGPVFNPPMDGSELKNVSHNNTSELSLLISALEEQQKRTVTTLKTDNSEYTKKLDEIFNLTVPSSEIVPQNENLNTSTIFNEKFQNARSVIDSKLDIVLDAEKYLNELRSSAQKLTSADDGQVSSDVSRSIEGISSIVADLTSTKSASSDLKAALSKLPSFDEAGNIVNVPEAENKAESSAQSDDVPFELTPQSEELSVDEAFAQAQKEALAQLEQDKELENQLKEDAQRLNQSLRDSAINLESVINPQTEAQGKTDLLKNEDDHYIQNLDEPVADAEQSSTMEAEACVKSSEQTTSPSEINPKEDDKETTVSNTRTGIEVSYVAGYFEGNTKEVTEIIPDRLETLDAVLSEVESTVASAPESIIESAGNKTVENELSPSLQQAVDAALSGNFGQNLNAATENVSTVHPALSAPSVIAESTESSVSLSSVATESDLAEYPDAVSGGSQNIDSDFTPVNDDDDSEDDSHIETVRVSDLKAVDNSNTSETENNLIDGNPKIVRESTLKLIEAERQFENRRLGRKLEPKDFYYKVEQTDSWFQTILKSGYNDGPVFSALCYSKRTIDPNDQYKWKLQISDDFELMTMAPDFHHNLRTRFSFVLNHPVEIELESFKGIPPGCPEELARMWYIKEIENAKYEISQNEELNSLLSRLGEDLRTLNISIYTQSSLPSNTDK